MKNRAIAPVLVGRGMAGNAILQSLDLVARLDSELQLLPARIAKREEQLKSYIDEKARAVLFLANPSGMHAQSILEGIRSGFNAIAVDKPVCVCPEEMLLLQDVDRPVTVFHGYRVLWGSRKIRQMIVDGELGDVFAFESRYWQSSAAQEALNQSSARLSWKNDILLNGPRDALTDLGSHAVDMCHSMMGTKAIEARAWLSYCNAAASHRDTHVHLQLKFSESRNALISISKTAHGAANDFEYTVFGTRATASWKFMRPDEVEIGSGSGKSIIRREAPSVSAETKPFHGLGWLEGYVEITRQTLRAVSGLTYAKIPSLKEALDVMDVLLHARIET